MRCCASGAAATRNGAYPHVVRSPLRGLSATWGVARALLMQNPRSGFCINGIVDVFDTGKDYGVLDDYMSFEDHLTFYQCVGVPDDYLSLWLKGMSEVKTYYHCFSRHYGYFTKNL
jgi:hypothetical protein